MIAERQIWGSMSMSELEATNLLLLSCFVDVVKFDLVSGSYEGMF